MSDPVTRLQVLVEGLTEDVKELKEQQSKLNEIVIKWRLGAMVLFGLGAATMWVLQNIATVKKFFLG